MVVKSGKIILAALIGIGLLEFIPSKSFAAGPPGARTCIPFINRNCIPPRFPRCGNGRVERNEECDDGNQLNTDDCTNRCLVARCNDGYVQTGEEECDDGNLVDTDDCRNDCTIPLCGDGIVSAPSEQCDDGNSADFDGCSSSCHTESPDCLYQPRTITPSPCPTWTRMPAGREGYDIALDSQGNVNVVGTSYNPSGGWHNIFVGHYGPCGELNWSEDIDGGDGGGNDFGNGIDNDSDGNIYITGVVGPSLVPAPPYARAIIRAFRADGGDLWTRYFDGPCLYSNGRSEGRSINVDDFGNLYVAGNCRLSPSIEEYWIGKYSRIDGTPAGSPWPIFGPSGSDAVGRYSGTGIVTDPQGNIFTLINSVSGPIIELKVLKLTPAGTPDISFGTSGLANVNPSSSLNSGKGIAVDHCGREPESQSIYTTPFSTGVPFSESFWLTKFNHLGMQSGSPFPIEYSSILNATWHVPDAGLAAGDVAMDRVGNVYVTGAHSFEGPMGCRHIIVSKYSAAGELLWSDIVGNLEYPNNICGQGRGIAVGPDGSVYVIGDYSSLLTQPGEFIWIGKYTPCGVSDDGPPDVQNDPACSSP